MDELTIEYVFYHATAFALMCRWLPGYYAGDRPAYLIGADLRDMRRWADVEPRAQCPN